MPNIFGHLLKIKAGSTPPVHNTSLTCALNLVLANLAYWSASVLVLGNQPEMNDKTFTDPPNALKTYFIRFKTRRCA
jgi:hypothetical protein